MLEMWLRLGQTNNKLSPTWRQEEKEYHLAWQQKEKGQDTTWRQRNMVRTYIFTAWRQRENENKFRSPMKT